MRPSRARLANAARRAMIQRAELGRKLGVAGEAFKPKSLYKRGKYRAGVAVDDAAHAVQKQFKDNRLPIALAAAAGLAWLFREPIKEHAPRLGRKLRDLAEAGLEKIRPDHADGNDDSDITEDHDEAAQ
ncbi:MULTISPECIES: hypothetical protein [unclassified Sphingopyxis]|uniref:hypothetical protein n=1 Tax=unclassified Sphingopyxis TaxID=2614943 RepID=UPI000737222B|nr:MULTISPECIES: hypothetical protein [unclassified Sphingopyxis]KTE31895.1 hypothetical protein ATE62_18725 [Sphingopyxis sp. HIX]KTE80161.1 hypothetical protein ATE72_18250 [Sphingopyxis sp. HXXIV]